MAWLKHLHKHLAVGGLALTALLGCAKLPSGGVSESTRLIFRVNVNGQIRSDYVYIIPIRVSVDLNPTGDGPIPVIGFPTNNGFVAGNVDYFVQYDGSTRAYTLFRFTSTDLSFFTAVGVPLNTVTVNPGSNTLGFELALEQLVTTPGTSVSLQAMQANFLTMNRTLTSGTGSGRVIDALGNTNNLLELNQPVRIPLKTSGFYDNARFGELEPITTDCPDPDLDLRDWSIEVRLQ